MEREIRCIGCNKYLGVIRDAKLLKGIVYLCPACETKRKASDMAKRYAPKIDNPFAQMFGGK